MNLAEQLADTIPAPAWPKRCLCGASYDENAWKGLRLVGRMDDGDGGELELRDCRCHSTLAIEVR